MCVTVAVVFRARPQSNPSRTPLSYDPLRHTPSLALKDKVPPSPLVLGEQWKQCQVYKKQVELFFTNAVYPTCLDIVANPNLTFSYLENDVNSRITPIGQFLGIAGTIEYFYSLATSFFKVSSSSFEQILCEGDVVVTNSVLTRQGLNAGNQTKQVQFDCTFTFNPTSAKIKKIDCNFLQPGEAFDLPPEDEPIIIQDICNVTVLGTVNGEQVTPAGSCSGANEIWVPNELNMTAYDYCIHFLSREIRFGTYNRAWSNSVVCRMLHSQLTIFAPETHCPHVSPSGGNTCVDVSYDSFFDYSYLYNNYPPPPTGTNCVGLGMDPPLQCNNATELRI